MLEAAKIIPWLPAIGAILCGICCTRKALRTLAAPICILSIAAAFVTAVVVSGDVPDYNPDAISAKMEAGEQLGPDEGVVKLFNWISIGSSNNVNDKADNSSLSPTPTPSNETSAHNAGTTSTTPTSVSKTETENEDQQANRAELQVNMGYFVDSLTILMLFVITGIGTLVAWYAAFYMAGDRGYARFFAAVCLFIFAMTTLVMADNLVLIYLGWEGVGLCSYLLIGFYYDKPSAVAAAKKAFIVNRVGDLGFALGIFLTYMHYDTVSLAEVTAKAGVAQDSADLWIPFLLMLGAFGKSAQIPLYVWLPDAMEGPTPVSALIHAATMVTAGVYMISRLVLVFSPTLSPYAMPTVAVIGGLTALFAATIALCQYDIKRIFAYSTISQLGYMFLGVGVLSTVGGVFHLFTHAFFKALLFLTAGSVMHALAGQLDLRKMSGLRHKMPVTCWLMFAGCLALAGFPFTSGFYSKDLILAETLGRGLGDHGSKLFLILAVLGLFTAFLTSFYTFRLWFRVFLGPEKYEMGDDHGHGSDDAHPNKQDDSNTAKNDIEVEHHHEPHEMPWLMNLPLFVLAIGSIFAGYFCSGWVNDAVNKSSANVHRMVTNTIQPGELPAEAQPFVAFVKDENAYLGSAVAMLPADSPHAARALLIPIAKHARATTLANPLLQQDPSITKQTPEQNKNKTAGVATPSLSNPPVTQDIAEATTNTNTNAAGTSQIADNGSTGVNEATTAAPIPAPITTKKKPAEHQNAAGDHHHLFGMELHTAMQLISGFISIAGILCAAYFHWLERPAADRVAARFPRIARLLENKYYIDELYHKTIVAPLRLIGELCFAFDRLAIEPIVNLVGYLPRFIGKTVQPTQRGYLQGYGLSMLAGVAILVLILVWRFSS